MRDFKYIRIPADIHERLRIEAFEKRISMMQLVENILREHTEREK